MIPCLQICCRHNCSANNLDNRQSMYARLFNIGLAICVFAFFVFGSANSIVLAAPIQQWWDSDYDQYEPKTFEPDSIDSSKTGWAAKDSNQPKSIEEMGYRDRLSDGDKSKEREKAAKYVPWDFSWLGNWFRGPIGAPGATIGSGGWSGLLTILLIIGFVIVVLVLAFLIRKFVVGKFVRRESVAKVAKRKPKLADLPFQLEKVELTEDALWRLAIENRNQGNYSQAIIYLYSYLLLHFDRQDHLILRAGKTNRAYLAELPSGFNGRGLFAKLMFCFEDTFFGKKPVLATDVDTFIRQCDALTKSTSKKNGGRK